MPGKWWRWSFGGGGVSADTPAPQTLMVWSYEPDTILLPSLLKPTDAMGMLWAFSLLVMSSRVSVQSRRLLLIGR